MRLTLALLMIPGCLLASEPVFVHPGTFLDSSRFNALEGSHAQQPQKSAWNYLKSAGAGASGTFAGLGYTPHPVESLSFVSGGGSVGWREFVGWDAPAAYHNALAWAVTREARYAEKVMQILDAWAKKDPPISGAVNQSALDVSKGLSNYVFAEELVRHTYPGWDTAVGRRWQSFVTRRCLPRIDNGTAWRHVLKNGRTMMIRANMLVAISQDDKVRFDRMVEEFRKAVDGETYASGQVFDTMRDLAHALAQVAGLITVAEIAWSQGVDLYSYRDNRLHTIAEFHAHLRNSYKASEHADFNLVADYPPLKPDTSRRVVNPDGSVYKGAVGKVLAYGDEVVFHHYVLRKKIPMPELERRVRYTRERLQHDGYENEGVGLYTLTHGQLLENIPTSGFAREDELASKRAVCASGSLCASFYRPGSFVWGDGAYGLTGRTFLPLR